MARIRTIKPEIATHEGLYDLELETNLPIRFAWCMLFTICDREGRFAWRPRALKAHVLPYDLVEFSRVLDAWLTRGFVVKYRVGNDWYGWVPTFTRHQVINNREVASSIPPVEKADEVTDLRNQQVAHASSTREAREDDASSTREARVRHAPSGEGKGREGKGKERNGIGPTALVASATDRASVEAVFAHWQSVWNHPNAKLDEKRRKVIRRALELYNEALLCQCITGYRNSPHHTGQNDRSTVYDSIELLLRDAQHIDAGLRFYTEPPRTDLSEATRRTLAQTEGWQPPEVRLARG